MAAQLLGSGPVIAEIREDQLPKLPDIDDTPQQLVSILRACD